MAAYHDTPLNKTAANVLLRQSGKWRLLQQHVCTYCAGARPYNPLSNLTGGRGAAYARTTAWGSQVGGQLRTSSSKNSHEIGEWAETV